jgi:putative ABC transport system permease protein
MRHAIRSLRRSPGLVVVSVLSLGLGLGVISRFSGRLTPCFSSSPRWPTASASSPSSRATANQFSYLNYRDLLDSRVFDSVTAHRRVALNLRANGATERIEGLAVTPNFFEFIGAPMTLGRQFTAAEAHPSGGDGVRTRYSSFRPAPAGFGGCRWPAPRDDGPLRDDGVRRRDAYV